MSSGSPEEEEDVTKHPSCVIKLTILCWHEAPWGSESGHDSSFPPYQTPRWEHPRSPASTCWINSPRGVVTDSPGLVTWAVCLSLQSPQATWSGTRTPGVIDFSGICVQCHLVPLSPATVILKGEVRSGTGNITAPVALLIHQGRTPHLEQGR